MKFVHLTPQPKIARVKRNGIRCGGGRRGRGVYAVPLMLMELGSRVDDDIVVSAKPRSSITLWQWLTKLEHRHRNVAAIVFQTTAEHWPADLYLELKPAIGTDWLDSIGTANVTVTDDNLQFVHDFHERGWIATLELTIHNTSGMGKVLHAVHSRGHTTLDRYDESIEIVFPAAVASNSIERVTPLYRTNKQFKLDRRQRKADWQANVPE